ncbi:DegV family protein [Cohnella suwonensis]|uniref:DegV family protein n=1 Tax=Cohnella suwonensis TaxID=696072 RepID=A0ABW0M1F8_9BACL
MASVAVVTDSTADIPLGTRTELGISMVPLKVLFGSESYLDNITLQPAEFYERLPKFGGLPTTSQPSPADYLEVFERLLAEGKSIVSIHLSGAMSGTYQSATIARSMLDDDADVTVIDSKSASFGYGQLVVTAAEMARDGASKEAIVAEVRRLRDELKLYFVVGTLEYLQKGGRIGKASAVLGSLLNIKPILSIDKEGVVYPFDKARGQKRAFARIVEVLASDVGGRPVNLTVATTPGHTEGAAELTDMLKRALDVREFKETDIGPVIGAHAGPGTIGLFVFPLRSD